MKLLVGDHALGSAKCYAGYTPGDNLETVFTGANSQRWNDVRWNKTISKAMLVSDAGTNRVATLDDGRTVSYSLAMDGNVIASVTETESLTIPWLICFKNPGASGKGIAALISGTWTLRDTTASKNYHMIRYTPGLGGSATRICCSSADGDGNDFIWSDDYFATRTTINITGAYGAFAFDADNIVLALFSRTAGADLKVTVDGSNFDTATNPVANIVLFNGVADGNGFNACASSGSSLGIKTSPSNIASAATRYLDYTNYIAEMTQQGFALPSESNQTKIRTFLYGLRDNNLWNKVLAGWIADLQSNIDACRINFKSPDDFLATKAGTITFTEGSGFKSSSSGYLQLGFIPSTHASSNLNNLGVTHKVTENVGGSMFDYGCSSATTSNRIAINVRDGSNTINSISMSSASASGPANADAIGRYSNNRTNSTAADHDVYKNGSEVDGSSGTSTALPNVQMYWGAFNNNGTASLFATRFQGLLIIHEGLTPTEVATLHTLMNY
jgi:hypothetical protein